MQQFGIDQAAFYTPPRKLDLSALAVSKKYADDFYYKQIGQKSMSIAAPGEDCITLAAHAATTAIADTDKNQIGLLLFATESAVDQSKAAAIPLHKLLKLPSDCRCIELKQACYSATAGMQLALTWLQANPNKKALIIASDIAHYALDSDAEASQGAGAVALLLSANPRLLVIDNKTGYHCEDIADFWRPNYNKTPIVDGPKSCAAYLRVMRNCWQQYQTNSARSFNDHKHFCFHIPFPKLVETAMQKLYRTHELKRLSSDEVHSYLGGALDYSREIGNCYTASLYISIISLLENNLSDLSGQRIGLYSYGSGAMGEYFSAVVQNNYQSALHKNHHQKLIQQRENINIEQYKKLHQFSYITDGGKQEIEKVPGIRFAIEKIDQHQRYYVDYADENKTQTKQQEAAVIA
jgi:hydroxymethylglutaryl-CoA synthase